MQTMLAAPPTDNLPAVSSARTAVKYLVFQLGREEFAVPVLKVREIVGIQEITAMPETPACVKGVINLRGKVIPVIDLRIKCGLPESAYTQRTCIVVVQVQAFPQSLLLGVIVDEVLEVLSIADSDIESDCQFGRGVRIPYLLGLAKIKGAVKILVDIEQLLSGRDLRGLDSLLQ